MASKSRSALRLPPGRFQQLVRFVQARLPELNFITLHYAYFILTSLLSAVVFWGSSDPFRSVSFIDSLFLTTSAMTEAGLNTVNLSQLTTWQQVMLFILIMMGSAIFVSIFVLFVRLKAFEKAFESLKKDRDDRRLQRRKTGLSRAKSFMSFNTPWSRGKPVNAPVENSGEQDLKGTTVDEEATLGRTSNNVSESNSAPEDTLADQASLEKIQSAPPGVVEPPGHIQSNETIQHTRSSPTPDEINHGVNPPRSPHIGFDENTRFYRRTDDEYEKLNKPLISFTGVGAVARASIRLRSRSASATTLPTLSRPLSRAAPLPGPYTTSTNAYFTSGGWISRNSQFHGLSHEERLLLGGCEYRAVVLLSFIVPLYFILWQLLGAIACGLWVANKRAATTEANGIDPFWTGSFNAISAFNNSGMSLLDANMVAFQNAIFLLISMGLFIIAGNTGYPIFLRAIVWTMWKLLPDDDPDWMEDKRTLRFLLDHPRRVYTNMFPSRQTWWLGIVLVVLNGIDWAMFEILNIGNYKITYLSPGIEVIDGWFQALAVRSGGFYVVPIPNTRIALQFLYVIMMYISAYPVVITLRNSNVYEERSLGVYAEDIEEPQSEDGPVTKTNTDLSPGTPRPNFGAGLKRRFTDFSEKAAPAPKRETRSYFVRQQIRAQLSHDAWFLVLAVWLILIIEASQFEAHPVWFSVFNVIFEVVSGYATVGISVGVPYNAFSFSGSWHTLSKLVLIIVMLRGRHRGLPVAIDHAVQLPGAHLYEAEVEDGERRLDKLERRATSLRSPTTSQPLNAAVSTGPAPGGPAPLLRSPRPLKDPATN